MLDTVMAEMLNIVDVFEPYSRYARTPKFMWPIIKQLFYRFLQLNSIIRTRLAVSVVAVT